MRRFRRFCGMIAGLSFAVMVLGCETLPFPLLALLLIIFGAALYFGGFMYGIFYNRETYGKRYRQPKRKVAPTAGTVRATNANV